MVVSIHDIGTDNDDTIVLSCRKLLRQGLYEIGLAKDIDGDKTPLVSGIGVVHPIDKDVYLDIGITRTRVLQRRGDHRIIAQRAKKRDGVAGHDQKPA
ncbi:hypothetical protein D3C86_1267290 [compost metagenome]